MAIKIKDKGFEVLGNITLREILYEIKGEAFKAMPNCMEHNPVYGKVDAICKHYLEMIE